jgi:microcystin-dependent protein
MASTIPIGSILSYAGIQTEDELNGIGWLACKGQQCKINEYKDLFLAIGTSNGGDGVTYFNLPDLRGMFLRGTDSEIGVKRDKDADTRTSPRNGAASGNNPGSIQGYATANAKKAFTVDIPHVPNSDHNAYHGSNESKLGYTNDSMTVGSGMGGGKETRPINANVRFILKYKVEAQLPAGLVIPFAGTVRTGLEADWLFCDGKKYNQTDYVDLFNAINTMHGGTGSQFNIPDYRGKFLRGVDEGVGIDPDAKARIAAAPGGASGDNVGSIQKCDTAKPQKSFSVTLQHMSLNPDNDRSDRCCGHTNSNWNNGDVSIDFTSINHGGDNESRPINSSVDWFIKTNYNPQTGDFVPIGTAIAFSANTYPSEDKWMACDGSQLPIISPFINLFNIIGTAHGGDGIRNFVLPDYRGMFLRGVDHGAKVDPDASSRVQPQQNSGAAGDNLGSIQDFATARPASSSITGSVPHLPTEGHDNACAISGCSTYDVCAWNGNTEKYTVSGGDKETRPVNLSVVWYIKYADA